ncbi:thiamine phosphate synthase [Hyphomicrobium sp.]|uniref:thiamine phosphate synthase n=1 Tax=Hyphomicrobium sp. TaxID=82 RepID=UPI002CF691A1|nr:thiamine phosphate synthase [Hyphomicrobium sp.]HRN87995.1 thiamine phosphate synthase [Hyphomicrobium sp.]HRQ26086.1 thiamine phosphate synthase [Hyphomicrobium sp.]
MISSSVPDVFYPIVPSALWLERLVPLGVRTVQLRIKDRTEREIRQEIAASILVAKTANCRLIVNDYWAAAIDLGATDVHLGQEDLATADLAALRRAGIAVGISTHDEAELETALAAEPAYVALGPIYETKLKAMKWAPQGLERIGQWKKRIGTLPLVAIGGITPERAGPVLSAGADSVAVITDFMTAPHPEARVRLWLDWAATVRV